MSRYALGVDLGTTYSAAAIARGGSVEPLALGADAAQFPSVVFRREDGEVLVGNAADRRAAADPQRAAREFKRRLGDPVPIVIGETTFTVEELMGHVLTEILRQATTREGEAPAVVVLTHPANYTEFKIGLLRDAARLAGIDSARLVLLSEPEAAAIAYGQQARIDEGEIVAVYDFGGGTFDAALVRRSGDQFELIGVPEGMERLGGIDFDQAVLAYVDSAVGGRISGADRRDPGTGPALARLRNECRRAKEALSVDTETDVNVSLPGFQSDVRLTRTEFEAMIAPRIEETVRSLQRAVASAGLGFEQIARVLLVGGTSRLPLIASSIERATGRPAARDAHPKLAIAIGAALAGSAALPREAAVTVTPTWRPPTPSPPPTPTRTRTASPSGALAHARSRRGFVIGAIAVAAVAAGVAAALAMQGGDSGTTSSTSTAPTAAATQTTPAATTSGAVTSTATTRDTVGVATTTPITAAIADVPAVDLPGIVAITTSSDGPIVVNQGRQVIRVAGGVLTVVTELDTADGTPGGVTVTSDGSVFVSTTGGVRRLLNGGSNMAIDASSSGLGPVAGPIAADGAGNLYVADNANHRIIRRGTDGSLSLIAGNGTAATAGAAAGDGDRAESVALGTVTGMAIDRDGNLVISDEGTLTVRIVSRTGTMRTVAGGGTTPLVDASETVAGRQVSFSALGALTVDGNGQIFVSEPTAGLIVAIGSDGATKIAVKVAPDAGGIGAVAFDPRTSTLYFRDGTTLRGVVEG